MSVFFLYPLFLFGLAAAALPILIHLLNRRRLKRIRFPAVRFILLSQKRISRSYRLRHWLLLALRTFAVIVLALLLANPIFQTGAGLFAGGGPVTLVLLLDNSLSMRWSAEGEGFTQAREAARMMISALNEGDLAAVIPTRASDREPARLKSRKDLLLNDLEAIELADGSADFAGALGLAYELLREPAGQKEIRLITDMALSGWDQFSLASLKQMDPSIPLRVIRVGAKPPALNGTIKEVRLGGPGIGVNLPLRIEAVLSNFGGAEIKDALVQLNIDGQNRDQKLATVPPKGETTVTFQTRLSRAGAHSGEIVLQKEGLAGNGVARFTLEAQDKLRVLIVDGDPQTSLVQSETFFLSRALNPAGEGDSSLFLPTTILAEGLAAAALENYQAVILCNVGTLSDALSARLQAYLRQGGGLLIFAGDKLQLDSYNQSFAPALPARLAEKKLGLEGGAEKIGHLDADHPALQAVGDPILQDSLRSARVWSYIRAAGAGKNAPISLANGDPLLLEQRIGSGKVMFVTTSADRDWNDLPVKTVYLPLMHSLVQYLAGSHRGRWDGGISVGAPKDISLPPAYVGKTLRVATPAKQQVEFTVAGEKDRGRALITENHRAGIYRLSLSGAAEGALDRPQLYAVNPPFLESRLEAIGEGELRARLAPVRADVIDLEALREGGKRTDLALPLLLLLIVTLLFEGWLGQRF